MTRQQERLEQEEPQAEQEREQAAKARGLLRRLGDLLRKLLRNLKFEGKWDLNNGFAVGSTGLGIVVLGVIWWWTHHQTATTEVPNVIGLPYASAERQLHDKDLTIRETRNDPSILPPGSVVGTDPPAGSKVNAGTGVIVFLAVPVGSPQPSITQIPLPTGQLNPLPTGQPIPLPTGQPIPLPTGQPNPLPTGQPNPLPTQSPVPTTPPTPTPSPKPVTPAVHIHNDLVLGRYNWVDLDNGAYNPGYGGDLYFGQDANTLELFLQPMQNSTIASAGNATSDYNTCATTRTPANKIVLNQPPDGTVICALTGEGRVAAVRINGVTNGSSGADLHITYTTWERP